MELIACPPGHSRVVSTPHPITCEGQRNFAVELQDGERLGAFLRRTVPDWTGDAWEVRINGVVVPVEVMERVRPRAGTLIEVRGVVRKQALYIVAMAALTYFTFGLGTAAAGAWGAGAAAAAFGGGIAGALFASAVFVGGSMLINKVLGPKPASGGGQASENPVHSLGAGRNQIRQYQPLPLVFGRVKFAPDVLSNPYSYFEGDDQYVAMVLTPGLNVHRVEELYLGDALLSSFDGVQVYYSGFPGMPEQEIPLFSDADTVQGGTLTQDRAWVQRTTPARTVRIQINLEYILGDQNSKQKPVSNRETVEVEYRVTGATNWMPLVSRNFANSSYDPKRATLARDVFEGQYDVRVRILGRAVNEGGSNGRSKWDWTTMTAVQADTADYAGIPRIGILMKATGQLQGAPDEIRCVAVSAPVPVWNGTTWVTQETSNPAAHILAYSRGITDQNGVRIAGIGLKEDQLDVDSLQTFCLHCAAENLTYDFVIKDQRSHIEMVDSIAAAGFGQTSWGKGRLAAIWAADEQPEDGVVNMATISKGSFQVDYMLANAADGVEVTYFDVDLMKTRPLKIPAPGVETMLAPAQITLEGVGHEAQAAMLGRWHLAQSLYQYKDITYGTDIEHLSYGRMSLLRLSHDLTQWGFSGQVQGASLSGGVASIVVSEPVRAPSSGKAYVGLRIPGERNYRVFEVQPFEGETRVLTLVGQWPSDAALPGRGFYRYDGTWEANPAHDTVWCYDFKATPGYRVRVVAIEPESDAKAAQVAVVPEGPEFWNYVRTGIYIPAPNESLLPTRPIASDLRVSERNVVQGDTVFTELVATFEITGPVGDVIVQMSNENGELVEVARTTTRTAAWRIPGAGTYQVVVRPFSPDGRAGVAAATIYSTIGADAPPVLVDLFDVEERSGGVRLYTWGWLTGTTQSADFAGVEIRYLPGSVPAPEWDAMTPVGEDGYHTAPFEAVIPESGQWTFAARSRNTSGTLSTGMRVLTKTLGANLGEQIGGIGESLDEITQRQVEQQAEIDQEKLDRAQAILEAAQQAAADATAKANAARDAAIAQVDALAAEVAEIVNAPQWSATEAYQAGWIVRYSGAIYRAEVATTNQRPDLFPAVWERLGEYESVAEVAAAALRIANQTVTALDAEITRLDAIVARMPTGAGGLATSAMVASEAAARVNAVKAQADRIDIIVARLPAGSGSLATAQSVNNVAASVTTVNDRVTAVVDRTDVLEAKVPQDGGRAASVAAVTAVDQASAERDTANASATALVSAQLAEQVRILNPSFEQGEAGWGQSVGGSGGLPAGVSIDARPAISYDGARSLYFTGSIGPESTTVYNAGQFAVIPTQKFRVRARTRTVGAISIGANVRVGVRWMRADGSYISNHYGNWITATAAMRSWAYAGGVIDNEYLAPDEAVFARVIAYVGNNTEGAVVYDAFEISGFDMAVNALAQAVSDTTATVSQQGGLLQAQAGTIQGLQTAAGEQSASLSQVMQVQAVSGAVQVLNAGMESEGGWGVAAAGTGGLPTGQVYFTTARVRSGARALRFDANATIFNAGRTPTKTGEKFNLRAYFRAAPTSPNAGAQVSIGVRWYDGAGSFMSGMNQSVTQTTPGGDFAYSLRDLRTVVTAPEGAASVQVYLVVAGLTVGGVILDDVTLERLSETEVFARAAHTIALDVNGNVSGTVNENDGTRSVFSIIANVFRVISSGSAGLDWQDGYLRAYFAGAQLLLGGNFGTGDLMMWAGPNVGAANCTKANGLFWLDSVGTGYFAGDVLQGVLRAFQSNTTVSPTATVSTGTINTKTKQVSVEGRFVYTRQQVYPAASSVITLAGGATRAAVLLERRYRNAADTAWENFVTLSEIMIPGTVSVLNESDGPSVINHYISGTVNASDAASTRKREYRTRVVSISTQAHTVANPGTVPAATQTQYQSIESME